MKKVGLLKRNCFASVFAKYFDLQAAGTYLFHVLLQRIRLFYVFLIAVCMHPNLHPLFLSFLGDLSADRAVIHYRDDETLYVKAGADRVTVIFSTVFKGEDDIILGRVFLQEFNEGKLRAPRQWFSIKKWSGLDSNHLLRTITSLFWLPHFI